MRRVLFDTNIVSSWHSNVPEWMSGLRASTIELSKHGAELGLFVSSITFQELLFYAHTQGQEVETDKWLRETFTPLAFDHEAAKSAAAFQFRVGRPAKAKPKSQDRENVGNWFRDGAILGTAIRHKIDVVVTADEPFYGHRSAFPGAMMLVRAGGVFEWSGYATRD